MILRRHLLVWTDTTRRVVTILCRQKVIRIWLGRFELCPDLLYLVHAEWVREGARAGAGAATALRDTARSNPDHSFLPLLFIITLALTEAVIRIRNRWDWSRLGSVISSEWLGIWIGSDNYSSWIGFECCRRWPEALWLPYL